MPITSCPDVADAILAADARLLVADIGGTNCRLGLFQAQHGMLHAARVVWRPTAGLATLDDLLALFTRELPELPPAEADALVISLAGPLRSPYEGRTTNAGLHIDLRGPARGGVRRAALINDFQAQAYACLTRPGEDAQQILPGLAAKASGAAPDAVPDAPRGVIGAGTGLGTATLIKDSADQWIAIPSEAGHTAFPFIGAEECAFHDFARSELNLPYLCGDDLITGRGLALLHRYLAGERLSPHDISARHLCADSPTRRWYARFYARMCRHWALTTLCRGGLYIAGGIAAKNLAVLTCPEFAAELYNAPRFADVLTTLPVRLMTDENSGLWGAAWFAAHNTRW